jgi:predicted Zn finger-like uncharacterized protein
MIAACPKCEARYRIEREKLKPEGVRLRCSKCRVIFRVRPPEESPARPSELPPVPTPVESPPASAPVPTPVESPPASAPVPMPVESPPASAPVPMPVEPSSAAAPVPTPVEPSPASAPVPIPVEPPSASAPGSWERRSQSEAPAPPTSAAEDARPAVGAAAESSPGATELPPDAALVLVGTPDDEVGKQLQESLAGWGMRCVVFSDGVEVMLEIQRQMPRAVVLASTLPRMYGFQICEIVKRNESLRSIGVVLLGSIHHKDRYRRPAGDLYGADAYVEEPDLPGGLLPLLHRMGLPGTSAASPTVDLAPPEAAGDARPEPGVAGRAHVEANDGAASPEATGAAGPDPSGAREERSTDDPLAEARAAAERLARIIVSDIVLYNEEKFAAAISAGNVLEAMSADLDEGRSLFQGRIDERLRGSCDFLADELLRVARTRGAT